MKIAGIVWATISVLVAAGIFFASAQTGEASAAASAAIADWFRGFFPGGEPGEPVSASHEVNFLVRKGAHIAVYFVLAFCVAQSLKFYISRRRLLLFSWAIASVYGVFDEIHQYFVPGRAMLLSDMIINAVGAFIGAGIVVLILNRRDSDRGGVASPPAF
ncbi:MAG: VanZ family protein [Defluviitaleaceae bacterium]|nr:VanZ family protein [Defluviitaleaceae bacterium]